MIGRRRARAVNRDEIHMRQHLVQALPPGRLELGLGFLVQAVPVVIVDGEAEAPRPARDGLADPPHADDAEALAPDAMAQHRGGRPALPVAAAQQPLAFGKPARHREDQGHRHVCRVLGQHARRVGHQDAALPRCGEVDVIDAGPEVRDQLQVGAGLADDGAVDRVRHRRNEHVGVRHHPRQGLAVERPIILIESGVEKLHHARFDLPGETPRHHYLELPARPHRPSGSGSAGSIRPQLAACLAKAPWRLNLPRVPRRPQ